MKHKELEKSSSKIESSQSAFLILHNDDYNTFDFVIDSLMEVCDHDEIQAEQCALLTHYKGKCDVKKGENSELENMKELLNSKGLITTVEN